MGKNELQTSNFLTGYETRIYKGYKKTASDQIKDKRLIASTVKEALNTSVEVNVEGETVEVPLIVDLIALKLNFLKEHPDKIDLKEFSAILGEQKQEIVVDTQKASDIFGSVAIGAVVDDTCIE
jgi:hypothetical protein